LDREGRTIWIADAHRGNGRRYVVRADEKLTARRVTFFSRARRGVVELTMDHGEVSVRDLDALFADLHLEFRHYPRRAV
jgi:3,4-dihydroxy-2-butanone 4-phosphate synthase